MLSANVALYFAVAMILLVIIEGLSTYVEGTLYCSQVPEKKIRLSFFLHWGVVIGDFILIPMAIYLSGNFLLITPLRLSIYFPIAIGITWFAHKAWWEMCKDQPGFMFPDRKWSGGDPAYWRWDLPASAWIHFTYMILAIVFLGGYIFSPMPKDIVWKICWIFVVFVPVAIIEPGIAPELENLKKKDIINSVGAAIALWAVVALVTWAKLNQFEFHWHFISINL